MDPIPSQPANLTSAVQALLVRQGAALEGSPLMALLGQDVEALFQALVPGGVKLQLPSGQIVTAQGELTYPEGTQLRLRVLPPAQGDTSLRLQLQEARPPAPSVLLSPLVQSEAQTLAARLNQVPPPAELEPLVRLLAILADPAPPILSAPNHLQAALRQLPEPVLASLGRILGAGSLSSLPELTRSLQGLFQNPQGLPGSEPPAPSPAITIPSGTASLETEGEKPLMALLQHVLQRFESMAALHGEVPEGHKDALATWIRNLLQRAPEREEPPPAPRPQATEAAPPRPEPPPRAGSTARPDPFVPTKPLTNLPFQPGSKAEVPESWESWLRGTIATLSSPAASPREAPFHALQAKEGTAFFEIPVPWAQASPLQIWVESDAPEERQGGRETTKRVLLGLRFSRLGETRLGLAQGTFGLQVRIWSEHPESLEAQRERMEQELQGLGKAVDLKIYGLTYGPDGTIPSVRSLVTGPSLSALG